MIFVRSGYFSDKAQAYPVYPLSLRGADTGCGSDADRIIVRRWRRIGGAAQLVGAVRKWIVPPRIGPETIERLTRAWPEILEGLAAGKLVRDVLAQHGTNADALRAYKSANPQARAEWDEARERSADAFMDEAIEAAYNRELDPAHARMRVDTLKWAARIRNPRLYGDKAQLDVNVRTVDLTRIIEAANARLLASQAGRVIEHETLKALL